MPSSGGKGMSFFCATQRGLRFTMTTMTRGRVEERLFRAFLRDGWLIADVAWDDSAPALLLAVAEDQRIVGTERVAGLAFPLNDTRLAGGVHLSAVFDYSLSLFRRGSGQDIPVRLSRAVGTGGWNDLVTTPLATTNRGAHLPERTVPHPPPHRTLRHHTSP